jgi:hypothetical protein
MKLETLKKKRDNLQNRLKDFDYSIIEIETKLNNLDRKIESMVTGIEDPDATKLNNLTKTRTKEYSDLQSIKYQRDILQKNIDELESKIASEEKLQPLRDELELSEKHRNALLKKCKYFVGTWNEAIRQIHSLLPEAEKLFTEFNDTWSRYVNLCDKLERKPERLEFDIDNIISGSLFKLWYFPEIPQKGKPWRFPIVCNFEGVLSRYLVEDIPADLVIPKITAGDIQIDLKGGKSSWPVSLNQITEKKQIKLPSAKPGKTKLVVSANVSSGHRRFEKGDPAPDVINGDLLPYIVEVPIDLDIREPEQTEKPKGPMVKVRVWKDNIVDGKTVYKKGDLVPDNIHERLEPFVEIVSMSKSEVNRK